MNPFDYAMNAAYLNQQLVNANISPTINATTNAALASVRKAIDLLKAVSIANASSNPSGTKALGWSLDTMLISCTYNGVTCNSSDFFWWYSFEYGNCYTFNYKNSTVSAIAQTSKTGPENGLTMEIFTGFSGKYEFNSSLV